MQRLAMDVMLDLFLSLVYNPPHNLENKVMNICHAAEGYHRRVLDQALMPDDEFRALWEALTNACPAPWRQFAVTDWLTNANAPSSPRN